jgi:vacuolar protein sorting-associated protein 13A/C
MSLARLGKQSETARFLDDVDFTLSLNSLSSSTQQVTSIETTLKPIVFRASYGDIMLISTIVQRAIDSYEQIGGIDNENQRELKQNVDKFNKPKSRRTSGSAKVSLSKEQVGL